MGNIRTNGISPIFRRIVALLLIYSSPIFAQSTVRDCDSDQLKTVPWRDYWSVHSLLMPLDHLVSASESSSFESPWKGTALLFDGLHKKMINTEDCHLNETSFVACVTAMGTAVQYAEPGMPPIRWVPLQLYLENSDLFGKTLHDSELGLLAEIKPISGKSIEDTVRYYNEVDKKLRIEYLKMYRKWKQENLRVDFNQLFKWTKKRFVDPHPEIEEDLTAAVWISFLKSKFDPHTRIIPAQSLQKLTQLSNHSKAGIGVTMDINEFGVFLNPQANSPAEQAGVLPGDRLVALDGKPVIRLSSVELGSFYQSQLGKVIRLTVNRGGKVLDLKVRPAEVNNPDFSSSVIQDEDRQWSYLKLGIFPVGDQHRGCGAIASSLKELGHLPGIILDLRGNPGGAIDEARCIASLFLEPGKVVTQISIPQEKNPIPLVTKGEKISDSPLVVLVDGKSASASELLSGALQEHGRAVIVGDQTYGKGSFQSVSPLSGFKKVNLVRTEGLYYLPSGRSPQLVGITPDFRVLSEPGITQEVSQSLREVDSGPNPLVTKDGVSSSLHEKRIENIGECIKDQGRARLRYQQENARKIKPDYPLLYAQDVLSCMDSP